MFDTADNVLRNQKIETKSRDENTMELEGVLLMLNIKSRIKCLLPLETVL